MLKHYLSAFILFISLCLTSEIYSASVTPVFQLAPAAQHNYFFYYKIYDPADPGLYFIIYEPADNSSIIYNKDFFRLAMLKSEYENYNTLLNLNAMNFEFKHNVIPYINPLTAVKLFYILERLDKDLRVTDVFRTDEQQSVYRRKNWSPLDVSPHQLGLAMDMPPNYLTNPAMIENLCNQLNLRYLVHGRRGNRHIHINDISLWTLLTPVEVKEISSELCEQIPTECCSEIFDMRKGLSTIQPNHQYINDPLEIQFDANNLTSLYIKIEDIYHQKAAEIFCGVFESGFNSLTLDLSFLKKGNYFIIIRNDQEIIKTLYFPVTY